MIIGYARTSTVDQKAGFEDQKAELGKAGCERIFEEQISAVASNRPELDRALEFAREGDIFCVTKLDRLSRSVADFIHISDRLAKKGVGLRVLSMNLDTQSPTGALMLNVLASVAEFERQILLDRQRAGIQRAKEQGKYKGRKPTARARAGEVSELYKKGVRPADIAERIGISLASVYRLIPTKGASVGRLPS